MGVDAHVPRKGGSGGREGGTEQGRRAEETCVCVCRVRGVDCGRDEVGREE